MFVRRDIEDALIVRNLIAWFRQSILKKGIFFINIYFEYLIKAFNYILRGPQIIIYFYAGIIRFPSLSVSPVHTSKLTFQILNYLSYLGSLFLGCHSIIILKYLASLILIKSPKPFDCHLSFPSTIPHTTYIFILCRLIFSSFFFIFPNTTEIHLNGFFSLRISPGHFSCF